MADEFSENGLQVSTLTELTEELTEGYTSVYGDDINVDTNSPDGQKIEIEAQQGIDIREVIQQVNASFDPDQAYGRVLDQRCAINGIIRNEGSYTFQDIDVTVDRALNLVGLDDEASELNPDISNLYTIKDDSGNKLYLLSSQTIAGAGTYEFTFRAAELGAVEFELNTITTPVTIIAGVTAVNNSKVENSVGEDEETDAELKIRRNTSVAISSTGYLDGLQAALSDLDNVSAAYVYENDTDTTDSNGIPPHSIWCIVEGGDPDEIGTIIYSKKTGGCGMKGDQIVEITQKRGNIFYAKYDVAGTEALYIRFTLELTGGIVDEDYIKTQIAENVSWEIGGEADSSTITAYIKSLNSNYKVRSMQISADDSNWFELLEVSSPQNRFINSVDRITIT